ncbi:MAG: hypothetical protein WCK29_01275 [archaeon]
MQIQLPAIFDHASKHGVLISEEQAIAEMARCFDFATENLQPAPVSVGLLSYIRSPGLRSAIRRYHRYAEPIIQEYGFSNNYAVLDLHSELSFDEIIHLAVEVDSELETLSQGEKSLLLLANDPVIVKYESQLAKKGFRFQPNWQNPDSLYRKLVQVGRKFGHEYVVSGKDLIKIEK